MGLKVAVANGNWSSTSTWNGGILPVAGDIVASNGFTVTIDQNVNVDSITNTAQSIVTATAAMTGYSTPTGYLVEASNYQEPAWQAFDRNGSSRGWVQNLPLWISYTFPSTTIINSYRLDMYTAAAYVMQNFTFEGWNGSSWVVLHTVTGNSLSTYISPSIGNTTAYIKYRFYCTATPGTAGVIYQEIALYELGYESAAVQGGTFILNSGVTVTCTGTSGITAGPVACMTYAGTGTSTINANINPTISNVNATTLTHSGTGTLTLNGNIFDYGLSHNSRIQTVLFSGSGIFNITGNITGLQIKTGLNITGNGTCNIVGNLYPANAGSAVTVAGNATVNITGNIFPSLGGSVFGGMLVISAISAVVTFTGNIFSDTNTTFFSNGINITGTSRLNVIGSVYAGSSTSYAGISSNTNCYVDVVGAIKSNRGLPAYYCTGTGAINILSGPFISGDSGVQPIYVSRMHYRRTFGSYYEFRDNSTNGALPPAGSAPATRLVSPDTVVDAPIPANVRFGISYALGSQTGTMKVPIPGAVMYGVAIDNTVGTALLSPAQIWNYLRNDMNVSGSIGDRLKNCATVESTGSQIASFKSS